MARREQRSRCVTWGKENGVYLTLHNKMFAYVLLENFLSACSVRMNVLHLWPFATSTTHLSLRTTIMRMACSVSCATMALQNDVHQQSLDTGWLLCITVAVVCCNCNWQICYPCRTNAICSHRINRCFLLHNGRDVLCTIMEHKYFLSCMLKMFSHTEA